MGNNDAYFSNRFHITESILEPLELIAGVVLVRPDAEVPIVAGLSGYAYYTNFVVFSAIASLK